MPVECFPLIADARATCLILGSMPGIASLNARQYYAHRQNAFWRIMAGVTGVSADAAYDQRARALQGAKIAVWDVLQSCERPGSLDASIRRDSEIANDFVTFFALYPNITRVLFNGGTAAASFKRHCAALLRHPRLNFQRLPSTSAAHASQRFELKQAAWQTALASRS